MKNKPTKPTKSRARSLWRAGIWTLSAIFLWIGVNGAIDLSARYGESVQTQQKAQAQRDYAAWLAGGETFDSGREAQNPTEQPAAVVTVGQSASIGSLVNGGNPVREVGGETAGSGSGGGVTIEAQGGVPPNFEDEPENIYELLPAWRWSSLGTLNDEGGFDVSRIGPLIMTTLGRMLFSIANLIWRFMLFIIMLGTQVDWLESGGYVVASAFISVAYPAFFAMMIVWVVQLARAGKLAIQGDLIKLLRLIVVFLLPIGLLFFMYNGSLGAKTAADRILESTPSVNGKTCKEDLSGEQCIVALREATLAAEESVGNPLWLAVQFQDLFTEISNEAVRLSLLNNSGGLRTGALAGVGGIEEPNCGKYIQGMFDRYFIAQRGLDDVDKAKASDSILAQAAVSWVAGLYQPYTQAQYGTTELSRVAACHELETENKVPLARRQSTMAMAYPSLTNSDPDPASPGTAGHVSIYRTTSGHTKWVGQADAGETENEAKEARLRTYNWSACDWNEGAGQWQADPDWVAVGQDGIAKYDGLSGQALQDVFEGRSAPQSRYCTDRWVQGHNPIPGEFGEIGSRECTVSADLPLVGNRGVNCTEDSDRYNRNGVRSSTASEEISRYRGDQADQRLVYGMMGLFGAIAYFFMIGGPSVGLLITTLGVILSLILLPITLVGAAADMQGAKKVLRMTVGMTGAKALFTVFLFTVVEINFVVTSIINAVSGNIEQQTGAGFVNSALIMISPLIVMFVINKLLKMLGLGGLFSLRGATSMVGDLAGKASRSGSMSSFLTPSPGAGKAASALGKKLWQGAKTYGGAFMPSWMHDRKERKEVDHYRAKENKLDEEIEKAKADGKSPEDIRRLERKRDSAQKSANRLEDKLDARQSERERLKGQAYKAMGATAAGLGAAAIGVAATGGIGLAGLLVPGAMAGAGSAAYLLQGMRKDEAAKKDQEIQNSEIDPAVAARAQAGKLEVNVSEMAIDAEEANRQLEEELNNNGRPLVGNAKIKAIVEYATPMTAELGTGINETGQRLNPVELRSVQAGYLRAAGLESIPGIGIDSIGTSHWGFAAPIPTPEVFSSLLTAAQAGNTGAIAALSHPIWQLPEDYRTRGTDEFGNPTESLTDWMTRMSAGLAVTGMAKVDRDGQLLLADIPAQYGYASGSPEFIELLQRQARGEVVPELKEMEIRVAAFEGRGSALRATTQLDYQDTTLPNIMRDLQETLSGMGADLRTFSSGLPSLANSLEDTLGRLAQASSTSNGPIDTEHLAAAQREANEAIRAGFSEYIEVAKVAVSIRGGVDGASPEEMGRMFQELVGALQSNVEAERSTEGKLGALLQGLGALDGLVGPELVAELQNTMAALEVQNESLRRLDRFYNSLDSSQVARQALDGRDGNIPPPGGRKSRRDTGSS